ASPKYWRTARRGGVKKLLPHLLVVFALAAILATGAPTALRNAVNDLRFDLFPRQASGEIVVVAIDSPSIDQIGVCPWPRRLHAQLIEKLVDAHVGGIAFDVDFSTPSTPEFDQSVVEALKYAGGSVILPSFEQVTGPANNKTVHLNRPLPEFA